MTATLTTSAKSGWKRLLAFILIPALALGGLAISAIAINKDAFASPAAAGTFLAGTNAYRAAVGASPLIADGGMNATAQAWAEHMAATGMYEHDPNGSAGMPPGSMKFGENIDMGWSADQYLLSVDRWYNSPGHQANMLDPEFTHMGAGYAFNPETGEGYSVQTFASVNYQPPVAPGAPAPATVTPNGDETVTVSWSVPNPGTHPITETEVAHTVNGNPTILSAGAGNAIVVPVTRGVENTFTVRVYTQAGVSPWSAASRYTAPVTAPDMPAVSIDSVASRTATLTAAAFDGGAPITSYTLSMGDIQLTSGDGAFNLDGLSRNTYHAGSITVTNSVGVSAAAAFEFTTAAEAATSPLNLEASLKGKDTVKLTWDAPADTGGTIISHYTIFVNGDAIDTTAATSYEFTAVRGVDNAIAVTAENIAGTSPAVTTNFTAPITAPTTPTDVTLVAASEGQVILSWNAPADNGGEAVTQYVINGYNADDQRVYTNTVAADQNVIIATELDGIEAGAEYRFEIAAENTVGRSDYHNAGSVTTPENGETPVEPTEGEVPGTVDGLSLNVDTNGTQLSITADWGTPLEPNPLELLGYQVDVYDGEELIVSEVAAASENTMSIDVEKPLHTYTVSVAAINEAGVGEAVKEDIETPATIPNAPRLVEVNAAPHLNSAGVEVSWVVPSTDGGEAIIGYFITINGEELQVRDATSIKVGGLDPNTKYDVAVTAFNSVGTSKETNASGLSSSGAPTTPQNLEVVTTEDVTTATWNAPKSDGSADNTAGVEAYTVGLYQDGTLIAQPTSKSFFGWVASLFTEEAPTEVELTETTVSWTGLPEGDYTVKVEARNAEQLTSPTATADFTVEAAAVEPDPEPEPEPEPELSLTPENVKVSLLSANQAYLQWEAPKETGKKTLTGYTATIDDGDKTETQTVEDLDISWANLKWETKHTFTVVANYSDGTVSDPVTASLTTGPNPNTPIGSLTPEKVAAVQQDDTIKVTWEAPKEIGDLTLTGYEVTVKTPKGNTSIFNTTDPTYTVKPVTAETLYTITVASKFEGDKKSLPVTVTVKTEAAPVDPEPELSLTPENFTATKLGFSGVTLTWDAPKSIADKKVKDYTLTIALRDTRRTYTVDGTTFGFENLAEKSTYTFTVATNFTDGTVSEAVTTKFTTDALLPPLDETVGGEDGKPADGAQTPEKPQVGLTHETPVAASEKPAQDASEDDTDFLALTGAQNEALFMAAAILLTIGAAAIGAVIFRKRNDELTTTE